MKVKKTYYAHYRGNVIPCHLIDKKDRDGRGKFAANSKRSNQRFQEAFDNYENARDKAIDYRRKFDPDYGTFN